MSFSLATSKIVCPGNPVTSLPFIFSKNLFILFPPPLSDLVYCVKLAVIETLSALDADILVDDMLLFDISGNGLNRTILLAKSTASAVVIDAELYESLAGMSCALMVVDVVFVLVSEVANS